MAMYHGPSTPMNFHPEMSLCALSAPQRIHSKQRGWEKSNRSSANPVTSFLPDTNAELLETDLVSLWSGVWMRMGLGISAGLVVFYFWVWAWVHWGGCCRKSTNLHLFKFKASKLRLLISVCMLYFPLMLFSLKLIIPWEATGHSRQLL